MDDRFLRDSLEHKLAHVAEEVGELSVETGTLIYAIGKTQRWGPDSFNPLLPEAQRETNAACIRRAMIGVRREIDDLEATMQRLESQLVKEGYLD